MILWNYTKESEFELLLKTIYQKRIHGSWLGHYFKKGYACNLKDGYLAGNTFLAAKEFFFFFYNNNVDNFFLFSVSYYQI